MADQTIRSHYRKFHCHTAYAALALHTVHPSGVGQNEIPNFCYTLLCHVRAPFQS